MNIECGVAPLYSTGRALENSWKLGCRGYRCVTFIDRKENMEKHMAYIPGSYCLNCFIVIHENRLQGFYLIFLDLAIV